jgi:putative protease
MIENKIKTNQYKGPLIASPAGSLEKLKIAAAYGADEVYFGGRFNLRERSDNFSIDEINEALLFCGSRGVKAVFLLNSFLHENDIAEVREYIKSLREMRFDGVMISDPGMISIARESGAVWPLYLSTQMSTLNHQSARFWKEAGISRVVMAREATLDEIRMIKQESSTEIEVFCHGAVCVSYSGRCLLSRYMAGRDANKGDCAHPCRWRYALIEEKRPGSRMDFIEHCRGTEILASHDLCLARRLPEYISAGVDVFKIEGRMKSLYYAANTTRIYKHAVRTAVTGDFNEYTGFYLRELDSVSHRPYTDDIFNEGFDPERDMSYTRNVMFIGYTCDFDPHKAAETVRVKVFNPVRTGEMIDVIYPIADKIIDHEARVVAVYDDNGKKTDMARPALKFRIEFDRPIEANAIFRSAKEK